MAYFCQLKVSNEIQMSHKIFLNHVLWLHTIYAKLSVKAWTNATSSFIFLFSCEADRASCPHVEIE